MKAERWRESALCAEIGSDLFFPEPKESTAEAKWACARCPVRVECLEAGMGEQWGIWGGLTARTRRTIRGRVVKAA